MDQQQKENIIEDLLYEAGARANLNRIGKAEKKNTFRRVFSIAAAIILIAAIGLASLFNGSNDLEEAIAEAYEFPSFNKSRAAVANITDAYSEELAKGQYKQVLKSLEGQELSQQDLLVKANLYYQLDMLVQANQLIIETEWNDSFLYQESRWLIFLIALQNGNDKAFLESIIPDLKSSHKVKGKDLLNLYKE